MSRGRKANLTLIGVFVLGALVLALAALVALGSGRLFRHTVPVVCYFSGSVSGLNPGAPVKVRGVQIGEVTDIRFRLQEAEHTAPAAIRIPVWTEIDLARLSEFRGRTVALTRERLDELIREGLRAQLKTESFVTGVLYVEVDYFPGSPVVRVLPEDSATLEVPTMPTTLEQASETVRTIMARVQKIDLEGLVESARYALDGASTLVRSPELDQTLVAAREALLSIRRTSQALEPGVGPALKGLQTTTADARTSLQHLDATLTRLQTLTDPQAPLVVGLTAALVDLGEAARSVQELASYLDRRPNAILTGRPGS